VDIRTLHDMIEDQKKELSYLVKNMDLAIKK